MNESQLARILQEHERAINNAAGQVLALAEIVSELDNLPIDKKDEIINRLNQVSTPFAAGNMRGVAVDLATRILNKGSSKKPE